MYTRVWASLSIPRNRVITWHAVMNKLDTLDRVANWNGKINSVSMLRGEQQKTKDHLFFACLGRIRGRILQLLGEARRSMDWPSEIFRAIQ